MTMPSVPQPGTEPLAPQPAERSSSVPSGAELPAQSQTIDTYERRIRDLMSQKDRALADLAKAQARVLEIEQTYQSREHEFRSTVETSTQTTRSLQDRVNALEAENLQLKAETQKLTALSARPDLLPYAAFIPTSANPDDIAAAIARFDAVRQQDLARLTPPPTATTTPPPATPPKPSTPWSNAAALYPSTAPQSTPFASSPSATSPTPPPDYTALLRDYTAKWQTLDTDAPDFDSKRTALIREGEHLARLQAGQPDTP